MKVLIELENEQEKILAADKIDEVKRIFNESVEIVYAHKKSEDIFDKVKKLSWDMGKKLYRDRDSLYDR
jgi:hypothetical protein